MRLSRCSIALVALAAVGLFACTGNEVTQPKPRDAAASLRGGWPERLPAPPSPLVQCDSAAPVAGSADIGPQGGRIVVGRNRLIVPAGALTQTVHITLTVPGDGHAFIALAPTGLVFLKQVRLVFDVRGCDLRPPRGARVLSPWAVYVDDGGSIEQWLPAWPNFWAHTVSTAIRHFSGYGLAW